MAVDETTSSDPGRALDLLWGDHFRPSRGPRRGLDLERVVRAAIGIADEEGLAALSMRRVAGQLGVGTASLYTYVPGRTELLALMLDAMIGEGELPHTAPGDWREKVQTWARADWAAYRQRPWVLHLASASPTVGPNLMRWYESALRALDGTGLSEVEMVSVVESVDGYVRGVAWLAVVAKESERTGEGGEGDWNTAQERFLRDNVDFSQFPRWIRAASAGAFYDPASNFEFGLQRMLDGIEAVVRAREPC